MKLTIENIEKIQDFKLPKLDGYTISLAGIEDHEYRFDIYYNHTLKMILRVNRDSNYDGTGDTNNYTCNIEGGGPINIHRWQVVLSKDQFKTKLGFLMAAGEMANKILLQQSQDGSYVGNLSSVSANPYISHSYNPSGFKIW
jgi:hypothetical protein